MKKGFLILLILLVGCARGPRIDNPIVYVSPAPGPEWNTCVYEVGAADIVRASNIEKSFAQWRLMGQCLKAKGHTVSWAAGCEPFGLVGIDNARCFDRPIDLAPKPN